MTTHKATQPQAVLFDCDGVLVDSEPALARIAALALADLGIPARPEDFAPYVGMGEDAYIGEVAKKYGFPYSQAMKQHVYDKYIEVCQQWVPPMPGAVALIRLLRQAGFRLAMATSADRVKANANLQILNLGDAGFDAIVTGDEVTHKKPHPAIYLTAAARCGVQPEQAWVIEDARSGVQSGKAAGMRVIGLCGTLPTAPLTAAGADAVVTHLREVPALLGLSP